MSAERRVAVVTGASAGVGRATVRALASAGYDVGLLARGGAGLDGAADDVARRGRRSVVCPVDVADFHAVDEAAGRCESELGAVDVWVNDAMATVFQRVVDTEPADFARAVEVTFLGQVWGTMAALARMRPRDEGTIVNVGSALSFLGIPLQAPYCSAKFACRGFVEALRAELLEEGSHVRVAMVHLPAVNTPQFDWAQTDQRYHPQPVPPIYQPEVAARAIVRAATTGRPSTVVGTWNTAVVAAASVAPRFGTRFAAITGVQSQLTDRPVQSDRPANLHDPADRDLDYGAHGIFDGQAHGMLDPKFLRGIPRTLRALVQAFR
jgi:short-subunit dehydrogenase